MFDNTPNITVIFWLPLSTWGEWESRESNPRTVQYAYHRLSHLGGCPPFGGTLCEWSVDRELNPAFTFFAASPRSTDIFAVGGATPFPLYIFHSPKKAGDRFYRQPIRKSFTLPTPFHAGYLLTSNAVPHERFTHLPISSRVLHHFSFILTRLSFFTRLKLSLFQYAFPCHLQVYYIIF